MRIYRNPAWMTRRFPRYRAIDSSRLNSPAMTMPVLAEGLILGARFRLVSLLGQGSMGQVWRVADLTHGRDIALKILAAELAQRAGFIELLDAECAKARRLMHPNIVRVHERQQADGWHFISMELLAGRSLAELRGAS